LIFLYSSAIIYKVLSLGNFFKFRDYQLAFYFMRESTKVGIIFIVVIIFLTLVGLAGGGSQQGSSDTEIKQKIEEKYHSSGTIDCTGEKSRTPECRYLLNLPSDVGGNWEP
jgi:hypothetical protein